MTKLEAESRTPKDIEDPILYHSCRPDDNYDLETHSWGFRSYSLSRFSACSDNSKRYSFYSDNIDLKAPVHCIVHVPGFKNFYKKETFKYDYRKGESVGIFNAFLGINLTRLKDLDYIEKPSYIEVVNGHNESFKLTHLALSY